MGGIMDALIKRITVECGYCKQNLAFNNNFMSCKCGKSIFMGLSKAGILYRLHYWNTR